MSLFDGQNVDKLFCGGCSYLSMCNGLGAADEVLIRYGANRSARLEALFLSYSASLTDDAFLLLIGQGRTLSCIMATRCLSLTVCVRHHLSKCRSFVSISLFDHLFQFFVSSVLAFARFGVSNV